MITKQQAVDAPEFHHASQTQGGGKECLRVRRNGKTTTLARSADKWSLPVKWGLRTTLRITQDEASQWHVASQCPRCIATEAEVEAFIAATHVCSVYCPPECEFAAVRS